MITTKSPERMAANVAYKVANGAKQGAPNRKIQGRLLDRIAGYNSTKANDKNGSTAGYRKPGSFQ